MRRVTIIPRGQALGVTVQTPEADRYGYTARYPRGRTTGALGGRAAEDVVYGEATTGAESDLDQATQLARRMVGRWGVSSVVGPAAVARGGTPGTDRAPGLPPEDAAATAR